VSAFPAALWVASKSVYNGFLSNGRLLDIPTRGRRVVGSGSGGNPKVETAITFTG